jgi:hypothetical protein
MKQAMIESVHKIRCYVRFNFQASIDVHVHSDIRVMAYFLDTDRLYNSKLLCCSDLHKHNGRFESASQHFGQFVYPAGTDMSKCDPFTPPNM